jgi:exopolysaccharide biosynthesis polyprenyl glycosylphosphotransferase
MAITFIYRTYEFSRLVIGLTWMIGSVFIYSWHELAQLLYQYLMRKIFGQHNVLIIGKSQEIGFLRNIIRKQKYVRTFFIVETKDISEVKDFIIRRGIEEIYITANYFAEKELLTLVDECELMEVDLKVISDILQLRRGEILIDDSLNLPIFHIKPISLYGYNYYFKRVFDLVLSIIVLAVLFIPLTFICLLIKLDSVGPIFYLQKRMGLQSRIFRFFKFRTMVINADEILEKIRHLSERNGPVFKMKNDPRITNVGKILRRYSIDELPQLINVLRGEMSLVGPRPQVLWEAAAYNDTARRRLRVLPGITGLWQVSGRAALSYDEMIQLDIFYIENWSLGLDIKIILRTLSAIFSKKGAY